MIWACDWTNRLFQVQRESADGIIHVDAPAIQKGTRMETSLSVMIGDYVHKLNGLIGLVHIEVKLLQRERANALKQDMSLATALERIEEIATQVLALTDEFKLSFASPEPGEYVSIKNLLSQALQESTLPSSVKLALEFDEGIPDIHATKNLGDVFRNLIANALEAMPNGGELRISTKVNQTEGRIDIILTDTGRGMPSYVGESLFQPYFSTKSQKGHGLGLWWSKVYLESIGGRIKLLSSEVGKGTSFLMSLPLGLRE